MLMKFLQNSKGRSFVKLLASLGAVVLAAVLLFTVQKYSAGKKLTASLFDHNYGNCINVNRDSDISAINISQYRTRTTSFKPENRQIIITLCK